MKLIIIGFLLLPFVGTDQNNQAETATRQKYFRLENSTLALQGYDPVSYHSGKALKGKPTVKFTYKGVDYQFSAAKNLETFKANPANYEPTYGGWCAYAMGAKGEKAEPDPTNFKLANGKVYLFYKSFFSNTLDDWNENEANLKKKADLSWAKLIP